MKKTAKKLLSMALVLVMVLSMLPAVTVPALAEENTSSGTGTGTKDAFGITMTEWTKAERAAAEADLPFGTGYGTWTTLYEKNELFFSMGYDSDTRLTGLFDWNGTEETTVDTIRNAIGGFGQGNLTSDDENYRAVATAAMDLYGTGKKEYVANLALNTSDEILTLYVTDSSNNRVAGTSTFINVGQLNSMEVHQLNGAFSIAAGDFDGDGTDTVVVYVPNAGAPFIKEYSFTVSDSGVSCTVKSTVAANVLTMLCNNGISNIDTMKNQPMVDLVAEDVDKDGFDELIITGGMNDVTTTNDKNLGSQLFIYDRTSSGWNQSYWSGTTNDRQIRITSDSNKRIVWASSSVGNIMVSTSTTSVDYPEIITAGFVDKDSGEHINVDGSDEIGVQVVHATGIKDQRTKNVICEYGVVFNQKFSPNGWTKGGFYETEDVNGLLQVQAYADRGLASAEAVFISGSVYRVNSNGDGLDFQYKHEDFNSKDDFATGGRTLTNTTVTAVTAGNFNGNNEGREQLICVTTLKQGGKNNAYSRVYCYYNKATCDEYGTWTDSYDSKRSSYLTEHKGNFHVSLAAMDTDNDSVLAKLVSVERDYSAPDVMAILESSPYFAEINDSFGNSETTYGDSTSSGSGSTNSFGFTLGVSVGYEFESDLIQSGGGFEIAVDNAFNWSTAKTTTVEIFREFRNDSGENLVVVYRCPVVTYQYVDQNGKELVVEKVGPPATSMITVEEYNEAAEQYAGLDLIDETNVKLGDPGDPFSYRENTQGLEDAFEFTSTAVEGKWGDGGWAQYYGSGSIMQGLTVSQEQEDIFSYDLSVSKNVFLKVGGVTAGATYGFTYGYEKTHISGKSVTKSGAVTGAKEDGYDFKWKFAAWNCTLNGSTVPVLGYLVQDVTAPPSPAMGLTAESFTTDSVTLRWSVGTRRADQYRIYRVRETAPQYVLVGAVQGDETSFTLTGLKPDETYTYVVRGVDLEGGNAMESVDSAPITVRTQSENSGVTLSLYSSTLTGSTLQSAGDKASIRVQVAHASGSCSYQWQLLETGEKGVIRGWRGAGTLAGKTIETVTGATTGTLTLGNIDESLDGSSLRCVVTVTSPAGDVDTYYSPVATLDLSGLDTTTTISMTGTGVTGSGSIAEPYTGMANYTTVTEESSGSYVNVPVTVPADGREYTIYQDAEKNVYVGVYDNVSTGGRTYCAVNGTYTLDSPLTLEADQYILDAESDYTIPTGFNGTSGLYEESNTDRYEKRYVVDSSGSSITLTEYWFKISDGQYYTKTASGFALANPQPGKTVDENGNETGNDLRVVYYDNGGTVILSAVGTDDYDHYQVYTVTVTETETVIAAGASFHRVPGTKLYNGETEYADSAKLTLVTEQQEVYNNVTTTESGTELTLSAAVTPSSSGMISFTITNTDTGAVTLLTATDGKAVWTAPKFGLYRIVATAAATTTTKASSAVCYYRADDPNASYRLTVKQGANQVTNIGYNGGSVTLELEKRVYEGETPTSTWEKLTSGVSYKVNNTACSSSYTPDAAGSYTFSALVGDKTVATAVLVVNKVPITVTPKWNGSIPATKNDITLEAKDAQGNPIPVTGVMTVSCSLYGNDGKLNANAERGVYTVTPVYVNNAAKKAEFLSRYIVTINTDTIYYFSDKIAVYFSAGENGKLAARYIDPSGTEFSFSDGSQISMDYGLKFVAEPVSGWSVETWTVTIPDYDKDLVEEGLCSVYGDTLEFPQSDMDSLKELMETHQNQISVYVTFTDQTHQITYSAGSDGGSLSATAGGSPLTNGASVAHNATVTFTAEPTLNMMVDKWTVNGAEYKWDDTDSPYRENTLILEDISADYEVHVSFTTKATTSVSASAVDTAGASYTGATVTVTDAQENILTGSALANVPQSSALTFTAQIGNSTSAVVKEWQTSTDGTNWTTLSGSGGQDAITIYEHGASLHVRVVIAVAQTYELSWSVSGLEKGDEDKAGLTAKSGTVGLTTNGGSYAVNTPVTFTLSLDDSYYVVGWTNATQSSTDPKSATLTLTDTTAVTVTVAKKPTVSWTNGTGGTVSVKGTVNGEANTTVDNGGYVDYDTTITVTLSPDKGYEVASSINAAYTDGTGKTTDNKSYTISNVQTNQTIVPAWTEIPAAAVSYSVVDTNGNEEEGGTNGTLTASVDRKGMSTYAVTNDDNGTETVYRDSVVTFTATPAAGYKVSKWFVNGEEKAATWTPTLTINSASAQTIQVQFDPVGEAVTYGFDPAGVAQTIHGASVSAVYQANGSTKQDNFPSGNKPTANGKITFTVSGLADGYEVEGWYVNSVKVDGQTGLTYTYSVTANVGADVKVKIIRSSYTVTFSDSVNGSVSATVDGNSISSGDSVVGDTAVTFTASPVSPTGYTFAGWTVNDKPSEETTDTLILTITENTVVKASYTQDAVRYTVTCGVIGENGTLSAPAIGADGKAAAGSNVVFTATPADGYRVKGWYSDAAGTTPISGTTFEQNSYTLENLLADAGVYVAFEPIPTYNITVNVTGLGTVTATVNGVAAEIPANGILTVTRYDDVVLTAAPDTYQYLTGWTLDGADQGNGSMTLTLTDVTDKHTVAADFAASQLVNFQTVVVNAERGSLTAKAGYGETLSTIDASTGIPVEKGKKVVVTASPNTGYMVKAWTVNGVVQDNLSNTLTIENLSEATTVTVEFEELKLWSITGTYPGCTITISGRTPSDYGTVDLKQIRDRGTVTFTVTPENGKYLTELTVNDTGCLTSTGTDGEQDKLTIQNNGDGSFTITVANVKQNITLAATALEFQTFKEELDTVPQELIDAGKFETVPELQTALRAEVKQIDRKVPDSQTALFDIVLKYTADGSTWVEADEDHFPAGGITVFIPYSDLGDTDSSYTFTVIHMFTTNMDGHTIGDTERIIPDKGDDGISFIVTSLSPFAIGWSKYTAPAGGGGGGGGAAAETVVIKDSANGKVTVDNTCAEEGDTVTLTVEPDKGYTLETLIVTDKSGSELKLKDMGNGKYTFTMPASNVTIKATFMEDNSMLNFFVDVPADAYYYDAVLWAAKEGITGGTDAVHFSPNATCTRAQAVTFLWRAAGSPAPKSSTMPFTDVAEGSYYHDAVLWAVENGITKGTSDTTFTPNAKCTRAQIVTFLWRSQKSPASDSVNPFTDVAADAYYANAVLWAAENGITGGTTATTFSPNNNCTRAQIVTFLYRSKK